MNSYESGIFAEFRARWFLRFHGFRILKSRYTTGRNTNRAEIDIIARRGNLLVFCEVKKRGSVADALEAVSFGQAARLRRAAESYIAKSRWRGDARFDAIAVCGRRIHWFKNFI
ncbi:MAG: YraN family protein [Rickettsiales bacterium]|nr:YraN family protein [Rickettsiales bacterium]